MGQTDINSAKGKESYLSVKINKTSVTDYRRSIATFLQQIQLSENYAKANKNKNESNIRCSKSIIEVPTTFELL